MPQLKRKTCIGIRPIDSRLYFVILCSPNYHLWSVLFVCNYLQSVSYLLVVHVFVSSEHTLPRVIYVLII
jgi:hypothetical protein